MADLNEIYNTRILELAAEIPRTKRLAEPDATATAHSKLCGSTATVDLVVDDDRVVDFGQTIKACLLGQASASVVGREIVGSTREEIEAIAATMRDMLKSDGPRPTGRWADLGVLEPVKAYRARHASTLLVFDAIKRAFDAIDAAGDGPTHVADNNADGAAATAG